MIDSNYFVKSTRSKLSGSAIVKADQLEELIAKHSSDSEAYHCFYDLEAREEFKEYSGEICPVFETIHLDFDDKESETPGAEAWEDVKLFVQKLDESKCDFQIYFSGNKGFHVAVHMDAFGIKSGGHREVSLHVKEILSKLQKEFKTIDLAIWDPSRKFRAYRSLNLKTKLYKTRLTDCGFGWENLTIEQIREIAKVQQNLSYKHPISPEQKIDWLCIDDKETEEIKTRAEKQFKPSQLVEVPNGLMLDEDESLAYETFDGKKCIEKMMDCHLPQFNRHDIAFRMICDMQKTGLAVSLAVHRMKKWANRMYERDIMRVEETMKMVIDAYAKKNSYKFSCYDPIKKAYCSGKCKVYSHLNPGKRHEPVDLTEKQKVENQARENPMIGLSEGEIADKILQEMPEICKAGDEFFRWADTHWERIGKEQFRDLIDKMSIHAYKNKANITKVKNLSNQVIAKIPIAPENNCFFTSSPNKFNFSDTTIEVEVNEQGKVDLKYKEHDKNDYLAYCAPFPFLKTDGLPRNGMFNEYLKGRINDIGQENFRILKQMMGAALVPFVPWIFFIEGASNSGKSTFALLIKKLLGEQNVSSVLPIIQGNGGDRFNWENAIGKIANIVLELPKGCELDVNTLKGVRDKSPVDIDRKGLKKVRATLPFLHIYCCNIMPNTYEGNSGALNNRVSIVKFKKSFDSENASAASFIEFADQIWMRDSGSVLDFAKIGLADLISAEFKYIETESSKTFVKEWQSLTDSVTLYLEEIRTGEWDSKFIIEQKSSQNATTLGKDIYSDFAHWCKMANRGCLSKQQFFRELEVKSKLEKNSKGKGGVTFSGFVTYICKE
jgi:phage/plasmid-associated DNA primase